MDRRSFCGLKQFVSTVFWRKSTSQNTRRRNHVPRDKDCSIHCHRGRTGSHEKSAVTVSQSESRNFKNCIVKRSEMRPNFRYLVHENSLAPFLYREEVFYPTREVNKREILRTNGRMGAFRKGFDPFLNTEATLPVAEESYDSGLLRMNTPWFS